MMLSSLSADPRTSATRSIEAPRAILLIVVAGIGDFVMATPAIRAVRNGNPKARVHLLTSTEAAALARRHPGIDRVLAFPIRELRTIRFGFRPLLRVLGELQRTRYDVAVNFYPVCSWLGSIKMVLLFSSLKAKHRVSHAPGILRLCVNRAVPADVFTGKHRADAMADVGLLAGGERDGGGLELAPGLSGGDEHQGWIRPDTGSRSQTIGINPGGDRANKRWPADRFAEVARVLMNRTGSRIVIFGGPGEESIADEIMKHLNGSAVNLAGRLPLEELPYAVSCCDLLVTNDSGPMHIAAAMKVPVVVVCGPTDSSVFGPYTAPERHRLIQKAVPCRPCSKNDCSDPKCMTAISPADVIAAATELLGRPVAPAACRRR
jgi:heptosyltransferase II